ncbi:MAG: SGNH/GDSL hydrolase family protein [Sulfitobacter sp.]|nr:SGNH/GDSL hydrolase family protein [Sulfitobacter sp.]
MSTDPNYNSLFVFGDSLSDNGAIFALFSGLFPPTTLIGTDLAGNPVDFDARGIFYDQKFTNGDVYADVSARLLGIPTDFSTAYDDFQGTNFAVGGATATDLVSFGDTTNNELADQVDTAVVALSLSGQSPEQLGAFLSGSAASIFIGLNDLGPLGDFSLATTGTFDPNVIAQGAAQIVGTIAQEAAILGQVGFGTIILNNLPSATFFPSSNGLIDFFGPPVAALFDELGEAIAVGIELTAEGLRDQGVNVEVVDFLSLAAEVNADKGNYGFQTLENLLPNSNPVTTLLIDDVPADQVGFIDPVHFTVELHEVFGAFQALTLGNEQIDGDIGNNLLRTGSGNQTIFAEAGDDEVRSGSGDDLVFAGAGADEVRAGSGDDGVMGGDVGGGGSGNDVIEGGSGNDALAGNAGDDLIEAGSGNDILTDGLGSDTLDGGSGNDFFIFKNAGAIGGVDGADGDLFEGGSGADTLLIVSDSPILDMEAYIVANNLILRSIENVEVISNADLNDYDFGTVGMSADLGELFGLF